MDELISKNYSTIELAEMEAQKYSDSPHSNGSVIAIAVASVPIIVLILIIVSFKVCEKVCPPGQRREFVSRHPRRISTFSTFSTNMSRNNSSNQVGLVGSSSCQGFSGSGGHLNLHHVHPQHHQQHVTIRADGTPLLVELETIREPEEDQIEEEPPLSFQVKV